jgi:chaperone modulatory protein CbpM
MPTSTQLIQAALEDALLSLDELSRAAAVSPQWVTERVEAGLLSAPAGEPHTWRFDSVTVQRVRLMHRYERDFEAVPELAALVADLLEEIASLRAQLHRAGG